MRILISRSNNAHRQLRVSSFASRLTFSHLDTRNNRDFGGTLTGFVFDGSSAGI
ncbi:hypothetical protein [Novosphingobium sp. ERN07]|uniref:hypothetical protein n=1 Tax=Novosphingobium sp. ERN07 TaxID=2726187 RepID=UPI0014564834|nr:hypothetical protein [Novosphingobium sp. ERN07]